MHDDPADLSAFWAELIDLDDQVREHRPGTYARRIEQARLDTSGWSASGLARDMISDARTLARDPNAAHLAPTLTAYADALRAIADDQLAALGRQGPRGEIEKNSPRRAAPAANVR